MGKVTVKSVSVVPAAPPSSAPNVSSIACTRAQHQSRFAQLERVAGLWYLTLSAACSIYYLRIAGPSFQNDLFWPRFEPEGAQTYLLDTIGSELGYRGDGSVDLFEPGYASLKAFGSPTSAIEVKDSYPRTLLMARMSIPDAIVAMQSLSIDWHAFVFTQYCWVDIERRWELAHTSARAARCLKYKTKNAAMYLELILRNTKWSRYMQRWGSQFTPSIGAFVNSTTDGPAWFDRTIDAFKDVASETRFWTANGVDHYQLQWHNYLQQGIDESIIVENALGWRQKLTTTRVSRKRRGALWTTAILYWALRVDYWAAELFGDSIVRQAPNFMPSAHSSFEDVLGVYPTTPASVIIHDLLGPFISIDMVLVAPPPTLVAFVSTFEKQLMATLVAPDSDAFRTKFLALSTVQIDPVPLSWRGPNMTHFGGSAMCAFGSGTPFVQPQFSFVDSCGSEAPATLVLERNSMLFAIVATHDEALTPGKTCTVCSSETQAACTAAVASARDAMSAWGSTDLSAMAADAAADIVSLQVEMIQLTIVNQTDNVILRQPLLEPRSSRAEFNYFGWIQLVEWAKGYREVVAFEGDASTQVLMSERMPGSSLKTAPLEVPAYTCKYMWYISIFTTVGLVGVAVLTLFYVCLEGFEVQGQHLFMFNRVVGPVWVGRPLMLIRAITAIVLLSTAQVTFVTTSAGLSHLKFSRRYWFDSVIVAGEATWLTYVVNDFLLVFTGHRRSRQYAPMSSVLVWGITLTWELLAPVQMTSTLHRQCARTDMDAQLTCTGGTVAIGALDRVYTILLVNVACVAASFAAVTLGTAVARRATPHASSEPPPEIPFLVAAGGAAFLDAADSQSWTICSATSAMCGLLPFKYHGTGYVLDTKLWLTFDTTNSHRSEIRRMIHRHSSPNAVVVANMTGPALNRSKEVGPPTGARKSATEILLPRTGSMAWQRVRVILGVVYLLSTLLGSVSYLIVAKDRLANDFWWEKFNSSGVHAYLGNWINAHLIRTGESTPLRMDNKMFSDTRLYAGDTESVQFSAHYIRATMFEDGADVATAIRGLRETDPRLLPWIATQYCWVDFDRQYEMANSAARQRRCLAERANGAVFLESVLRNINDWSAFYASWGHSFDVAIAAELQAKPTSKAWLDATMSTSNTEPTEVAYWTANGIERFTTQWQNYKSHGMFDAFTVENAFGLSYPLTLKATNGTFRLSTQTSMKMYWTWASDLWAVASPNTLLTGKSLLRRSSSFAFTNVTMEQVLFQNRTMASPLGAGYQLFHRVIGPFGSVDLKHVSIPPSLVRWFDATSRLYAIALSSSDAAGFYAAQDALNRMKQIGMFMPQPPEWDAQTYMGYGGNMLCNELPNQQSFTAGMMVFFGVDIACNTGMSDTIYSTTPQQVFALIATGLATDPTRLIRTCGVDTGDPRSCLTILGQLSTWTTRFMPRAEVEAATALAQDAAADIRRLNVEIMQYAKAVATQTLELLHRPLIKATEDPFDFYSWGYLYDWATGHREVVAFEGDSGRLTLLSAYSGLTSFPPNPAEVPVNVSTYFRGFSQYITGVLICVSVLVMAYSIWDGFQGEAWNFYELNRVAGIVWIGRPLLFLRSMTALCLLSTSSLQLAAFGSTSSFVTVNTPWYTTMLASGELCWLVYIINDFCMVYTLDLTREVTVACGYLSWLVTFILSLASPVVHSLTLHRACHVVVTDLQVVCTSGTLAIGDSGRFWVLVGIAAGASAGSMALVRAWYGPPKETPEETSLLLSCGAKYLFYKQDWMHRNVYYVDFASAIMSGLLVVHVHDTFYVLDIKVWRTLAVPSSAHQQGLANHPNGPALRYAFPLVK